VPTERRAIDQAWINGIGARYIGGDIEIRRTPNTIVRGPLAEIVLDDHDVTFVTEWTAVMDADFSAGLGTPLPRSSWRRATEIEDIDDVRRLSVPNDEALLSFRPAGHNMIAMALDPFVTPSRQMLISLLALGHSNKLERPAE